jgi:opacity protein-like surface antigen
MLSPSRVSCSLIASAALAVSAFAASPAAAAADTTPPTPPTDAYLVFDSLCTGAHYAHWRNSTDNVDSPTQLRYRFYDGDGEALEFAHWGRDVPGDPQANGSGIGGTWFGMFPSVRMMRAVDRAGNLSAPVAVTPAHG